MGCVSEKSIESSVEFDHLTIGSRRKKGGPTVSWFDIQQLLNYTESDTLLLLDCCHSSQSARDTICFELLAGCAMKRETLPPGPYSFTTALIREIEELLHRWGRVEVAELHNRLINRRARLSETPVYVPLRKKGARDGIWLTPIGPSTASQGLADAEEGLYSLQLNVTATLITDNDDQPFRKLTHWMRRGLPEEVIDISVEKVMLRAEKLETIVYHQDQLIKGQPILQVMDGATSFGIRKLWRSVKDLIIEGHSLWAASSASNVLLSVGAVRERLARLIGRIDAQNEGLTNAIGQGAAMIQELDEVVLDQLEHDETIKSIGLAEMFRLQRLVRFAGSASLSIQVEPACVRPITADTGMSTWLLDATDELVIVERKSYDQYDNAEKFARAAERIQNLANLLAVEKSEPFHSLACRHWFHDDYHKFFGIIFSIPDVYKSSTMPLKLFFKQGTRAPLEQRFKMAACLCQALQKWHSVNWLHKGVKSDSIFVFQRKDSKDWDFEHPFLSGHEYARPNSDISSARYVENFEDNVYRHPDRQGLPGESHKKIHDIYSLGVVLLEIGLWQSAEDFREFRRVVLAEGKGKGTARLTPQSMREALLANARSRLGHYMGSDYQSAVIRCLSGELRAEIDNIALELQLAQSFKTGVYDSIARGIALD